MADIKKSVNLLPEYLRTDKNSKFLSSTIDQLIQTPQVDRVDGYVGSKITPNYNPVTDFYINELSSLRNSYSLEPSLVFKDSTNNITDVIAYDDLINELGIQGGKNTNLDTLFRSKFYSFDPLIDWDKLINYTEYYWLPQGPELITLDDENLNVEDIIGAVSYTMSNGYNLSNGMRIAFLDNTIQLEYQRHEYIVEGVGSSINLIDFSLLSSYDNIGTVFNETFDSDQFDGYPFDGDKKLPIYPDYITINRASLDLNPWTRYNRWFHKDVINISAAINDVPVIIPVSARARRPIIEFKPNLQLYNFGKVGIQNVDLIDTDTKDAFNDVDGTYGYYIDGVLLEQGHRVIFNAEENDNIRGRIYKVDFDISGPVPILKLVSPKLVDSAIASEYAIDALKMIVGLIPEDLAYDLDGDGSVTLEDANAYLRLAAALLLDFTPNPSSNYSTLLIQPDSLPSPSNLESAGVNLGSALNGTSWHFHSELNTWVYSQQHTKLNQPPLFDLYTNDGISYTAIPESNDFTGSQIFGYDVGTGATDAVLGFPLKFQNTVGVGSYLFKNYFMTDSISITSNNVSSSVSTAVTFLKLNDSFVNIWAESVDYQIPIIEIQTISESTNTLTLTCIDAPIDTSLSVSAYVNNVKVDTTTVASTAEVVITTSSTFSANASVVLKILTSQTPNANGYYETPIGLTNNPLNGSISNLTLGELGDHLSTMANRTAGYTGNNLRDLSDYTKYGTRLVVNTNPIAFTQIFLGKKEHNVVDAIRQASDHYNQFKMNLLRLVSNVDSQLSAADALDLILTDTNKVKDLTSLYQRSDMLGYGKNKTVRTFTVTDVVNVEYPIGFDFDLTHLSFQSVIVYFNSVQLLHSKDYTFDYVAGSVTLLVPLAIDDVISINCYSNTLGCYIPPTPSKLGLYPSFEPIIFTDTSYVDGPVLSIQGHDGSVMKAYGDYRDAIILEYEIRVFNNIKVTYNSEIFDITAIQPGAFRDSLYTVDDLNSILITDFSRWAGLNSVDTKTNNTYDEGNAFTWNYTGSVDNILTESMSGYWRNLFRYFYDTDRPNTHPWEMLGFSEEPSWWISYYGTAPYASGIANLWIDLENGYIAGTDTHNPLYARPGLSEILPVDIDGNLRSPNTFLVSDNSYQDKQTNWKFGDYSPAENAWRKSSYWPFAINAASVLLNPCDYCAGLYDVSRTQINTVGQVTYKDDDLYLSPKKLSIDGENNDQIAGFGTYVIEKGKQKDQDYIKKLRQDYDYLDVNLFHKLGGFASKEKLQIIIDSIDPNSTSPGVVLPSEDYSLILNVSNPIKAASISGIIVQRSNGNFVIKGYDVDNPYFEILSPIKTAISGVVKVGGVSEEFSEWSNIVNNGNKGLSSVDTTSADSITTRYYKQGQLLRYNNKFYRVKIGHNAESTFDSTLYQQLAELPVVGGASAQLPNRFETAITHVPYGTEFTTVQSVYDVIVGYGAFLESQGFIFDEFNVDLNEILNWKFTGKEFLYWTTQNWADGNLITLSPFANYLKYNFPNSTVDNISTGKYEYSLLKADGKPYPIDKFTMSRDDTICTINATEPNEGLFFATLNSVQKEHGMVFNNYTVFNDTIYDTTTGYKQRRIKLSGFRTKNWNGDLFSPGFVFDNVEITDWVAYKNYLPGMVVRYNGRYYESLVRITADSLFDFTKWDQLRDKPVSQLLPNFDYKINQFEDFYSLDIDNFDYNQQQLAQHLTGYTPRTYLNNIFTNPISQYKFYQGLIKDKGTKNAIDKLSKASQFTNKGAIEFKEEWAFRVGHYGSFETFNEIEFPLTEGSSLENPYIVKFVDSAPSDANPLINYVSSSTLLLTPSEYAPASTFATYASTWEDNDIKLTTAGYVRPDDITTTAYNKNSLLDIANNSIINNGDTVWLGFLENGDWTVYRYINQLAKITGVFVSAPGSEITFVTDSHHNFGIGDIISVVRFNEQVDGVYVVSSIPTLNQFTVASTLSSIENAVLINYGSLYKFDNSRYANFEELAQVTDLLKLGAGDKVWIDNGTDDKWQVYEKIKNYTATTIEATDVPAGQKFGYSIFASDDSPVMMVSAPSWRITGTFNWGRVKVYNKVNSSWVRQYDYILNTSQKTYCSSTSSTQFGYSLQYDIEKKLYFTGAPEATYVRATGTNVLTFSTGSGHVRPYVNEGLVKISSRPEEFGIATVDIVLVNPYGTSALAATNSRFGHSIYIDQVAAATSTTMLVSAPGTTTFAGTGSVYAYRLATVLNTLTDVTTATVSVHPAGLKINSTSSITLLNGDQWGYKIAGSTDGTIIAISAPGYSTSTGVVQLFNRNLQHVQTILSPFDTKGKFGYDITISSSNQYLLISAPEIKNVNEPYGKVVLYSINSSGTYVLSQIIDNPLPTNDLKFGYSISIDKNETTIAIGALGKNRSKVQIFDTNGNNGITTFDNDSTRIMESLPDAGTVYVYNKLGTHFIQADELNDVNILANSRYGSAVVATNNAIFVGAPSNQSNFLSTATSDASALYIFDKVDTSGQSWKVLRTQEDTVDVSTINRVALIDTLKEELIEYLDVIDPVKGKIAGIADQELKYKAAFDPATYSIGVAGSIVDTNTSWVDSHIGELWWDLSTAKFMWYEQGDEIFRKNNWGKLFPGASIDVYEWVTSDLLPSEWAALADTTTGLTNGISGQPKYPDNSVISVKQIFNNVTGSFENIYYFWVKNKVTLPGVKNRRLSSYQVASYIADPIANGLKFIEILSPSTVAFANVQPLLIGDRINANIATDNNSIIPKHTEWLLLNEKDQNSVPNVLLEKKLFDSLLGHDSFGNVVPTPNLTYRNRYGIGIRPQQTLFKDRTGALRNLIYFVNSVLLDNRIVSNYSFENLNKKEEIPVAYSYEYDVIVEDIAALDEIITTTYVRAELECYAENGKIKSVIITQPGFGYSISPKVTISSSSTSPAEIVTEINSQGQVVSANIVTVGSGFSDGAVLATVRNHTAIVQVDSDSGDRWTKHSFDYILKTWVKTHTQSYNTPLFWTEVDWVSSAFNSFKTIAYTISDVFSLGSLTDIVNGDYVKIKNIGDGRYAILQRVDSAGDYIPSYDIVYKEHGTIQLSDTLWNYTLGKYAYDSATVEETLYDQVPDFELYYILTALKENIFVNSLKINWNLFFFVAVKYALTEQKLLDWAFKTSFINVINNIGDLDQRPVYKLNNEEYFEKYINEIKPYHTKIRSYTSIYNSTEAADIYSADFDLPSYYNTLTDSLDIVELGDAALDMYPWKSWADNYKLHVGAIEVGYAGAGYTQRPTVSIVTASGDTGSGATADAYIRNGEVYRVIVTNPGSGYTTAPVVSIVGGGSVTDTARVSVVMANEKIRKNIIGMKFDRTSIEGDIVDLTVTDEFVCDGTADKFTLTWLASPDKKSIIPLLDGKLVFSVDYTIEYYQIKVANTGMDLDQAFPSNSWEGESPIDHRYRYFSNFDTSNSKPGSIRHYAKFVFLNRVPSYGQIFKVTYNKNIDLYNAVDRINSLYNPTDLMPGNELPLLMTGAEYSGVSVQGLPFDQTPAWDNTGTLFDAAPWGDLVSNYAIAKLSNAIVPNQTDIYLQSAEGIVSGMTIMPLNTSTQIFRNTTVVGDVDYNLNFINVITLDVSDTLIKHVISTGTSTGSTIIIDTAQSFHNAVSVGDRIKVVGVNSLAGYGVSGVFPSIRSVSTQSISVTLSAPTAPGGEQAYATANKVGNTVTNFVVTIPGMGYTSPPTVTITGTDMTTQGTAVAYLDPGFNQTAIVSSCTDTRVEFTSGLRVSSTTTTLSTGSYFSLVSIINPLGASNKLLDRVTKTFTSATVLSVPTFAPFDDVVRAEILLSTTSTTIGSTSTYPDPSLPYMNPIWYSISASDDGRAIVSVHHINTTTTIYGDMDVRVFGATELEFYTYNTDYNSLDSAISGSTINDTALGFRPEDIVIDGNNFLNSIDSYAPEECVPGHVGDALGINVYTVAPSSYPLVMSGAVGVAAVPASPTRVKLHLMYNNPLGFLVYANGITFDRVANINSFSAFNQYCIFGDEIIIPAQPTATRVGYTFVTAGSDAIMDSAYVAAHIVTPGSTGVVTVSSLLGINDVRSAYVLVNGVEVNMVTTTTNFGYMLEPVSSTNNRAAVKVYALAAGDYTVEAWFFNTLYPKFNRVHEQLFVIAAATSDLTLNLTPGTLEPLSEQVIVEKITTSARYRMLPPKTTYYKIGAGETTFAIDPDNSRPSTYGLDNVKVCLNGRELRPGYDFTVNGFNETITLIIPTISIGDALAIIPIFDYEYIVTGNKLHFSTPISTSTIKVTSFTDHDNMMIRTERFDGDYRRQFTLAYPVISDNYVWVTVNNSPLIAGYDYKVLNDYRTIELSEFINVGADDDIVVMVINPQSYGSTVLGYRLFKDMFDRQNFKRLSAYFSTTLAQTLQHTDSQIFLDDGDHLLQPNPGRNIPGVVLIDSERIEYTSRDGNVLNGLRRGTLGTGPATISNIGTKVIDQSIRQLISTVDYSLIQYIPSSNTTTYTISNITNTATFSINTTTQVGSGITLSTITNAVDQIEVYYGGRRLRKTSLNVHDKSISYYDSSESTIVYPPEFTVTTSTQQVTLNIAEEITTGTRITVVKKEGALWTGTEATSLLSSTAPQAEFLRVRMAELPNKYFYGEE